MGADISCYACKAPVSHYRILYENVDVDEMWEKHNPYRNGVEETIKRVEEDGSKVLYYGLDYAIEKCKEIEPIVGKIRCTQSNVIIMKQFLCVECYKKTNFQSTPDEWGVESMYSAKGWKQK